MAQQNNFKIAVCAHIQPSEKVPVGQAIAAQNTSKFGMVTFLTIFCLETCCLSLNPGLVT